MSQITQSPKSIKRSVKGNNNASINRFQKFEIYGDASKANDSFSKYGHIVMPLAIKNLDREGFTVDSGYNLWVTKENFRKLLPHTYTFYPIEETDYVLKSTIEKELKDTGLKIYSEKEAHNGETKYWNLITDEKFPIVGDKDPVSIGVSVRNGVGTGVALGVDLFTVRWACKNGAIAKGQNMGSFSIAHVKKADVMTKLFVDKIVNAFRSVKDLIEYYRKSPGIPVTDQIANQLYKKLVYAGKYLPENWEVTERKEVNKILKSGKFQKAETNNLVKTTKKQNLWEVFNEITQNQRDGLNAGKIGFPLVARHQAKLHQGLIQVVNSQSLRRGSR